MCICPVGPDISIDRVGGMAGVLHSFSHHRGTNVSYNYRTLQLDDLIMTKDKNSDGQAFMADFPVARDH